MQRHHRSRSQSTVALLAVTLLTLTFTIAGCEQGSAPSQSPIIRSLPANSWILENLREGNLEPRLTHGLRSDGFYQYSLGPDWQPLENTAALLITQSRFVYTMAAGYATFQDPRYLRALQRSADYLVDKFTTADALGQLAWSIDASDPFHEPAAGQLNYKAAYAHAQAIFALAHAYAVTGDNRFRDAAYASWTFLNVARTLRDDEPGYLQGLNTAMHTFEALLVLYKATDSTLIYDELAALGSFIVDHFYLPERRLFAEWLNDDKSPQSSGETRLGHNTEMAFLLSRAVSVGLPQRLLESAVAVADEVASIGMRENGLIPHTINLDGSDRDDSSPWWGQTELLRSLSHFAVVRGQRQFQPVIQRVMEQTLRHYVDPRNGGWASFPDKFDEDKGHDWKAGYHVTMMLTELLRLRGYEFSTGREILL